MSFGEDVAAAYDNGAIRGDEVDTVAFLERLAGDGPVLELAIGTGRIGLPLAARGVRVDGIELSPAMAARLRAKPGGDRIRVTIGDFADDGSFVIEAFVPGFLYRLRSDQYVDAEAVEVGEVRLDVGRHDRVAQLLDESHVSLSNAGVRVFPIVTRYAWPSELDLMARIAGLHLSERWGGWNNEPFTATSERHVSVYRH